MRGTLVFLALVLLVISGGSALSHRRPHRTRKSPVLERLHKIRNGGCFSQYEWSGCDLDGQTFNLNPPAKCENPDCIVNCTVGNGETDCSKPNCEIQCQDGVCDLESCPMCETICEFPTCSEGTSGCNVLCEPTNCGWKIKKPGNKPDPDCMFNLLQEPACVYVREDSAASGPMAHLWWTYIE